MANEIKSHLLIGGKFLGALLYFKDTQGRGCLKLSFKNKIIGLVKATTVPSTLPALLPSTTPTTVDVSYKFQDSLLEIKKVANGNIEREFYKVPLPITAPLFIVKLKDWNQLDDAPNPHNPLVLTPPQSNSVVVVFSFLGDNGQPIAPPEYKGDMGAIDLPENPLNKFCIGIFEDASNDGTLDFAIHLPIYPEP